MARRKRKQQTGSSASSATVETTPVETVAQEVGSIWQVAGAAVRGVSHERQDLPCQDALGYIRLPGDVLLITIADGAGSASYSDLGAQAAVADALCVLEDALTEGLPAEPEQWRAVFQTAAQSAAAAVVALAQSAEHAPRNYASTLTMVAVWPGGLAAAQIGDGAVVAEDEEGRLFAATRLQRGEYANETHFLIEHDALDHMVIDVFAQPIRALAVMSDGLIRLALKLPEQEPHMPFFTPLFRFLRAAEDEDSAGGQLAKFLASERVNARTDDDKSLVLAARLEQVAA